MWAFGDIQEVEVREKGIGSGVGEINACPIEPGTNCEAAIRWRG